LLNANVGIFSLSYAVIPSFLVSVVFIDPLKYIKLAYVLALRARTKLNICHAPFGEVLN